MTTSTFALCAKRLVNLTPSSLFYLCHLLLSFDRITSGFGLVRVPSHLRTLPTFANLFLLSCCCCCCCRCCCRCCWCRWCQTSRWSTSSRRDNEMDTISYSIDFVWLFKRPEEWKYFLSFFKEDVLWSYTKNQLLLVKLFIPINTSNDNPHGTWKIFKSKA